MRNWKHPGSTTNMETFGEESKFEFRHVEFGKMWW